MKTKNTKLSELGPIRHDGVDKVTGRALYGADFQADGTPPRQGAKESARPCAKSSRLIPVVPKHYPGVKGVVTAADLPAAEDRVEDLGEGAVNLKYLS